ncbi:MAG: hypothetical protein ACRDYA_01365 [Egibacteraceae bacterium]
MREVEDHGERLGEALLGLGLGGSSSPSRADTLRVSAKGRVAAPCRAAAAAQELVALDGQRAAAMDSGSSRSRRMSIIYSTPSLRST